MLVQWLFILTVVGSAAAIVAGGWSRSTVTWRSAAFAAVIVATFGFLAVRESALSGAAVAEPVLNRPIETVADDYVGSRTCRKCHPSQHASWHDSYHRTMTQLASPVTVMTRFSGQTLEHNGIRFDLSSDEDSLWVSTSDAALPRFSPQNVLKRREIVMTTGSHHMQVYWMPLIEDAKILEMLPFTFHRETQRWMPRDSAFLSNITNEQTVYGQWNSACLHCHATASTTGAPTADAHWSQFETRASEFGISCEACHGPGATHVATHQNPLRRYGQRLANKADSTIVNPARLSHKRSSQVCGQCHSVFGPKTEEGWQQARRDGYNVYRPGDDLNAGPLRIVFDCCRPAEEYEYPLLRDALSDPDYVRDRFWSDGMARVTGREYNGLVDSPCFQDGTMSCLSCHVMHQPDGDPRTRAEWANDQLGLRMDTNDACLQCHGEFGSDESLTAHTHHPSFSAGSLCYNCHMPHTTYGLLKANRSHQIDSPSVRASLETGRPNACNQCHLNRTLSWTAGTLNEWYGTPVPELDSDEASIAASILWTLKGDAGQRALMAWSFGWREAQSVSGTEWIQPYLAELLADPYDAVRFIAWRSLKTLGNAQNVDVLSNDYSAAATRDSLRADWTRSFGGSERSALLIGDGGLQTRVYERLLKERDQTSINLQE